MRVLRNDNKGIRPLGIYLSLIKRSVALFFLLDFAWRYYSHVLVSQFEQSKFINTTRTITFQLYRNSGIQEGIVQNEAAALVFDLVMVASFLGVLFNPRNKWLNFVAFITFNIYTFIFTANLTFYQHLLSAMVYMSICFLPQKPKTFEVVWDLLRYYACFVYLSAGIYKISFGALLHYDSGILYLKQNLAQQLFLNPNTFSTTLYKWLITHPAMVNTGAFAAYFLEMFFVVGFFTKKFDRLLSIFIVFIHIVLYIGVDALFVEWFIFLLLFRSVDFWRKTSFGFPSLNK